MKGVKGYWALWVLVIYHRCCCNCDLFVMKCDSKSDCSLSIGSGFMEWGSGATVLGCNINHIGWLRYVVFFSYIALGSLLVLTVIVSSQFCFLETCIFMLGNYCMTAPEKPWGGLMWFVTAFEDWSTYRSQWLGRRDGGGKDVWTCAFCLSVCLPWDVGIVWIKTGRIDLGYISVVLVSEASFLIKLSAWQRFICQIHFWILLDLLFSSNFCTCARPLGLVWLSWSVQNFPLIQLVKQDQTLFL